MPLSCVFDCHLSLSFALSALLLVLRPLNEINFAIDLHKCNLSIGFMQRYTIFNTRCIHRGNELFEKNNRTLLCICVLLFFTSLCASTGTFRSSLALEEVGEALQNHDKLR